MNNLDDKISNWFDRKLDWLIGYLDWKYGYGNGIEIIGVVIAWLFVGFLFFLGWMVAHFGVTL